MKTRLPALILTCLYFLAWLPARGQGLSQRVNSVAVQFVGPAPVSEQYIRDHIRTRVGEVFTRAMADEDVKTLYDTGFFYNIRVNVDPSPQGSDLVDVTFLVQGKPILSEIKIVGNKRMSLRKIRKKITSKVGQPLDLHKIFDDAQAIQEMYEKAGYQKTRVEAQPPVINEAAGRGVVTFEIHETPKIKIKNIIFVDAHAFTQRQLRKAIKTRRRWMFSWLTGSGVLKEDQFEEDKDTLVEFYQNKGYIDFAITDIKFEMISPKWMIIRIYVSEGKQYKVGTVDFKGNKLFTTNQFLHGVKIDRQEMKLKLVPGATFTPTAFNDDEDTLRDMYGARGYLDQQQGGSTVISATHTANTGTGTIDLAYDIDEGEKNYIEKIIIKGNVKTKDRVLRRELSVYPGEVYDTVKVKMSKTTLEGLDYFSKVDTQAQETDVPNRKDLVIGVEEKGTGSVTVGAGFSSIESLVGYVEYKQANFDLFNPPTFVGAGQQFQVRASVGTLLQDYEISFLEPWFLDKRLKLGVDLFHRYVDYNSLNDMYTETFDGGTLSLTRLLFPHLSGTASYTFEDAHVAINPGFTTNFTTNILGGNGLHEPIGYTPPNISTNIYDTHGTYLVSKIDLALAYDTRSVLQLPDSGQKTAFTGEVASSPGNTDFYKLQLSTHWFFKGFAPGHIFELEGQSGVVSPYGASSQVPIFERWYLGGITSLRGYRYQQVGPEDQYGEPLGGDTFWFGSAEYSIPIVKMLRFAMFYDIGNVDPQPFNFNPGAGRKFYNDDVGIGLRIILPIIGQGVPLRLDYGFPIIHDPTAGGHGEFQFSMGYNRTL